MEKWKLHEENRAGKRNGEALERKTSWNICENVNGIKKRRNELHCKSCAKRTRTENVRAGLVVVRCARAFDAMSTNVRAGVKGSEIARVVGAKNISAE